MRRDPPVDGRPAGLYIHFPFCVARCNYCDFPTVIGRDAQIDGYLEALEAEIARGQPELVGFRVRLAAHQLANARPVPAGGRRGLP